MPPELSPKIARRIINNSLDGKFVREGNKIWVEEGVDMQHIDILVKAHFRKPNDAGLFAHIGGNNIALLRDSSSLNLGKNSEERDKSVEVAQKAVGSSANIVRR